LGEQDVFLIEYYVSKSSEAYLSRFFFNIALFPVFDLMHKQFSLGHFHAVSDIKFKILTIYRELGFPDIKICATDMEYYFEGRQVIRKVRGYILTDHKQAKFPDYERN
jgi:hypothetical protein